MADFLNFLNDFQQSDITKNLCQQYRDFTGKTARISTAVQRYVKCIPNTVINSFIKD